MKEQIVFCDEETRRNKTLTNYRDRSGKISKREEKFPVSEEEKESWIEEIPYKSFKIGKDTVIFQNY